MGVPRAFPSWWDRSAYIHAYAPFSGENDQISFAGQSLELGVYHGATEQIKSEMGMVQLCREMSNEPESRKCGISASSLFKMMTYS